MPIDTIERRAEPRTQAFVPVTLTCHDTGEEMPAHLLDLSCGGAGALMTAYNTPAIGQYLDVRFDQQGSRSLRNTDGGTESSIRQETGIVVNVRDPEQGIVRIGIRFLQHHDINQDLFDPREILTNYRKHVPICEQGSRWETARGFQGVGSPAEPAKAD
jgi:c-di-GMP-binding flagellar brake protein YcgR